MSKLSENMQKIIQSRIQQSEERLQETKEWIEKLEGAGYEINDLQKKQTLAEDGLERLRMLL